MKKSNPVFILSDDVADVIKYITDAYDEGRIQGIMVSVLTTGMEVESNWAGLNYLERLGTVESLKESINYTSRQNDD